jgi:hypothetical protein
MTSWPHRFGRSSITNDVQRDSGAALTFISSRHCRMKGKGGRITAKMEEKNAVKPRQAQLKIWGFKVGTPPPIAPVPERVTPSYSWRSLIIFALVILLFILLVIAAQH